MLKNSPGASRIEFWLKRPTNDRIDLIKDSLAFSKVNSFKSLEPSSVSLPRAISIRDEVTLEGNVCRARWEMLEKFLFKQQPSAWNEEEKKA